MTNELTDQELIEKCESIDFVDTRGEDIELIRKLIHRFKAAAANPLTVESVVEAVNEVAVFKSSADSPVIALYEKNLRAAIQKLLDK